MYFINRKRFRRTFKNPEDPSFLSCLPPLHFFIGITPWENYHREDKQCCDPSSTLRWNKEGGGWRQTKPIQSSLLFFCFFFFVSIFLCHLFFFLLPSLCFSLSQPRYSPSPPHNLTLPLRAARHRAVLYFFAHFSLRLVPSHADPYHAPVQCGRRWRKRVIFSPWVRTPHDKW